MRGKGIIKNSIIAAVAAGSLLATAPVALAYGGHGGDHNGGGSGGTSSFTQTSGYLTFYVSKQLKHSTQDLQWGNTYYVKVKGKSGSGFGSYSFWELHRTFYFYKYSQSKLNESPSKWGTGLFESTGTKVSNGLYEVQIPKQGNYSSGQYIVQTHLSYEGKYYYFTCGSSDGPTHVTIHGKGSSGDMPEVPYAGILPAIVLLGGGYLYLRRRRKGAH